VGFSDHRWLMLAVSDLREPAASTDEDRCAAADDLVTGVLATVEKGPVKHVTYGPDSFGGLDPCRFLDAPEVKAVLGDVGAVLPSTQGHECLYGHVGLSFKITEPGTGTPETIAGHPATVRTSSGYCFVRVDRPLTDRPGLVETAEFTGVPVGAGSGADTCADARGVAAAVIPKLPL
jgi:hypothetical protein